MKSKKAFLLGEHTINIIIGILAIVILVLVGMGIFGIFSVDNKVQQAQSNLGNIMAVISRLEKKDGGGSETRTLASPQNWILVGWPVDFFKSEFSVASGRDNDDTKDTAYTQEDIPNECKSNGWEKCLCFCQLEINDILNGCNTKSSCGSLDKYSKIVIDNNPNSDRTLFIRIDKPKTIEITLDKQNNKLSIIEKE